MATAKSPELAIIGHIIRMMEPLISERMQEYIGKYLLPFHFILG